MLVKAGSKAMRFPSRAVRAGPRSVETADLCPRRNPRSSACRMKGFVCIVSSIHREWIRLPSEPIAASACSGDTRHADINPFNAAV